MSREKKQMFIARDMHKIADILNLFLEYHPAGLLVFFGDVPFPDTEELAALVSAQYSSADAGVRIDGGRDLDYAQSVIEKADSIRDLMDKYGGLKAFRRVCRQFESDCNYYEKTYGKTPNMARLLEDLSRRGSARLLTVGDIACRYHVSTNYLYKKRDVAIMQLARDIYRKDRILVRG